MPNFYVANSLKKRIARSPALTRLMWRLDALVVGVAWWLLGRLSPERASALGRRLGTFVGPRLDKNRIVKRNLAMAFPERSLAEVEELARGVWGNVGAMFAEFPHIETICEHEADERLAIELGSARQLLDSGGQAIFVTAHLGNWDLAVAAGRRLGFSGLGLYNPLDNPYLDRMLFEQRRALGVGLVPRDEAMRPLLRQLQGGGSVGLLVDQRVDSGEMIPFFGMETGTSVIPARLALRFGCPLVPVQVVRLGDARFRIVFHEPVRPADGLGDDRERARDMTRRLNALFEDWIRAHPDQWMCSHRRWPKALVPTWIR